MKAEWFEDGDSTEEQLCTERTVADWERRVTKIAAATLSILEREIDGMNRAHEEAA